MKPNQKPTLLVLTSSFPSSANDETCGYIRDFARSLASEFNVEVLAPRPRVQRHPCLLACEVNPFRRQAGKDACAPRLRRAWSVIPAALDPFDAGADLNHLISSSPLTKVAAMISLVCFFIRAVILALRADALCSHWMVPCGLIGALISRALGKPHIVIEHSGALHLLGRARGGRAIARLIAGSSFRVITVSADLKRKLVSLCPEAASKTDVVSMGVSSGAPRGAVVGRGALGLERRARHTILFIGRLTEVKGLDILLKAIKGLDDVQLIIAGEGELREQLERVSRESFERGDSSLRGFEKAAFIGRVTADERQALLSTCDAVVIPSRELANGRTEGTPVVCLEAMAAGRVVIASRVGGLAEIISDGHNGLLFKPGDHRMLRQKLMLALGDDSLRMKMGQDARRSAEAFEWTKIATRFSRIINDSLDNGSITYGQRSVARGAD